MRIHENTSKPPAVVTHTPPPAIGIRFSQGHGMHRGGLPQVSTAELRQLSSSFGVAGFGGRSESGHLRKRWLEGWSFGRLNGAVDSTHRAHGAPEDVGRSIRRSRRSRQICRERQRIGTPPLPTSHHIVYQWAPPALAASKALLSFSFAASTLSIPARVCKDM